MTYQEIKNAARWVEQRENPSMSYDLFIWDNAVPTLWDDGQWDHDGPSQHNQGCPQYGGYVCLVSHSWPIARAVTWKNLGLRITMMEWTAVSWREVECILNLIPVTMRA